jgi:hypothetical protein
MITETDKLNIKKAKLYLDALMEYSSKVNFGNDDWIIPFMCSQIKFKTDVSLKCQEAHHYANEFVKKNL